MLLHAKAFRDLGFPAIAHGRAHRFYQKHFQNGKPVLPAAAALVTTLAQESDAGDQGKVLVPLAPSAHVNVDPEPDDGGQVVLVSLLGDLLVEDPLPPPPQQTSMVHSARSSVPSGIFLGSTFDWHSPDGDRFRTTPGTPAIGFIFFGQLAAHMFRAP